MADDPQPQKIPLIFYRTEAGSEPVREWLKGLPETDRQAIGQGPFAGAVAVAGGNAAVPPAGERLVGSADRLDDETDGACSALPLSRTPGRPARFYQEDADIAG